MLLVNWQTNQEITGHQGFCVLCADMFRLAPVIYYMDVVREHGKNMTGNKRVLRDKEELA